MPNSSSSHINYEASPEQADMLDKKYPYDFVVPATVEIPLTADTTFFVDKRLIGNFFPNEDVLTNWITNMLVIFLHLCHEYGIPHKLTNTILLLDNNVRIGCRRDCKVRGWKTWGSMILFSPMALMSHWAFIFSFFHEITHAFTDLEFNTQEIRENFTDLAAVCCLLTFRNLNEKGKIPENLFDTSYIGRSEYRYVLEDPFIHLKNWVTDLKNY